MPGVALQNLGLFEGWDEGEDGWGGGMNANLRALDALVQCSVISMALAAPPTHVEGSLYIVAASPSGDWVGHATHLARSDGAAWEFHTPQTGWVVYDRNTSRIKVFVTSAWVDLAVVLGAGTVFSLNVDVDGAMAANSDSVVPSQKAVRTYVDAIITGGASDVMIFKGVIDASGNPNYPAADAGNLYKISVAGKIGGASGPNVEAGDTVYCTADATPAGNHAAVGASWVIAQVNTDGAVIGPPSATDNHVAFFDGVTGKLLKDSGLTLSGTNTGDQTSVTGNAGTATALQTARTIGGVPFDGTADIVQPFDMHFMLPGLQSSSNQLVYSGKVSRAISIPANFAGSYFHATANATGSTVFDVQKNGSSIGSITIGAGGVTATFATSSGSAQTLSAGDVFAVICPATADTTLANAAFTFAFTR